ncbi:zf-HC2 domain-containing protein [Streptomyces sp. O3]
MTAFGADDAFGAHEVHEAVGAYALGVLDDAEVRAFEEHLADCQLCAERLRELSGMEPMLAALAELPPQRSPTAQAGEWPPPPRERDGPVAGPSTRLLDNLVGEVSRRRSAKRRRGLALAAAAALLMVGGPVAVVAATGEDGDGGGRPPAASSAADAVFRQLDDKVRATDPATGVSAAVGVEEKSWGTRAVLELKNVKGPLKCSLIAVGKNGEEETMTSWAVPAWGYGIEDGPNDWSRKPLYVQGGAAMDRADIDRFEVRTFDGERLVDVRA